MSDDIKLALEITVIGMSLVFGAIVLLWGAMLVLLNLTSEKQEEVERENSLKKQAAALAVAVALARSREEPGAFPIPATADMSAWQSIQRTKHVSDRLPRREPRTKPY